jgi:5-methyltetrahydropteroyltriglutamate--homocysteine methyltransferase
MKTQEIGSLAKPNWRVKHLRGLSLNEEDIAELRYWNGLLNVDFDYRLLESRSPDKIAKHSALLAIRLLEMAGLDVVFDGEQLRGEMYEYPLRHLSGFAFRGVVRSFDNKYYRKASCVSKPKLLEPYHIEEYLFTRQNTSKEIKVPVTGPYTLAEWSYDEYYTRKYLDLGLGHREAKLKAKEELVMDLAREVIRPNLEALVNAGARIIQVDEPALTTKPNEVPMFVEAFNEMSSGLDCKLVVHVCYGDYSLLLPHVLNLKNCSQLALEFANRDDENRTGYRVLGLFKEYLYERELGLGVVDVHSDYIESPELVKNRIIYASRFIEPDKIYVNPDCGLRTRTWRVAYQKLRNMVLGAKLAKEELEVD